MAAQATQLSEVVNGVYQNLLAVGLLLEILMKKFSGTQAFTLLGTPQSCLHRLKVASVWLRIVADGDLSMVT